MYLLESKFNEMVLHVASSCRSILFIFTYLLSSTFQNLSFAVICLLPRSMHLDGRPRAPKLLGSRYYPRDKVLLACASQQRSSAGKQRMTRAVQSPPEVNCDQLSLSRLHHRLGVCYSKEMIGKLKYASWCGFNVQQGHNPVCPRTSCIGDYRINPCLSSETCAIYTHSREYCITGHPL
jgi:hypothetical protein